MLPISILAYPETLLSFSEPADQMLKDAPNHPEGHPEVPAIEEEQTRTILDTESDHAD
jgi:receptor expression-enhancing protein 5/6